MKTIRRFHLQVPDFEIVYLRGSRFSSRDEAWVVAMAECIGVNLVTTEFLNEFEFRVMEARDGKVLNFVPGGVL